MIEIYYVLLFVLGEFWFVKRNRHSILWLILPITLIVGISKLSTTLLTLLLCTIVLGLTYAWFNRLSMIQSSFLAVIFFCLSLFSELISVIICFVLRWNEIGIQFCLSLVCLGILEWIVYRCVFSNLEILEKKDWWLSALLLLMPFLCLLILPVNYVQIQPSEWQLLLVFFVLSYGLLAYMYVRTFYFLVIKKDLLAERAKQEVLIKQQERLEKHYQKQFHSLHSILHELSSIDLDLTKDQIDQAKIKLESLGQQLSHELQLAYTESFYLSLVISEKKEEIEQAQLVIRTDMPYLRFESLSSDQIINLYTLLVESSLSGDQEKILYIQSRNLNEKMVMVIHLPVSELNQRLVTCLNEMKLKYSYICEPFGLKLTLME